MNCWFTAAAKMEKEAERKAKDAYMKSYDQKLKAVSKYDANTEKAIREEAMSAYDKAKEEAIQELMKKFDNTLNLGIDLMMRAHNRIRTAQMTNGERWYFLTVRPPPNTDLKKFIADTESFCDKWQNKWHECIYVYEQKGETEDTLGQGFHMHMRICTTWPNYYPSHILRDACKAYPYTAPNCIKLETVKSLERTIEYMKGDKKSDQKKPAVLMDTVWREKLGLPAEVKYKTRQAQIDYIVEEA